MKITNYRNGLNSSNFLARTFFYVSGLYAWFVMFVPYQLIMKTHMPLSDSYNNIFLNYYQHSYYNFDSNNLHIPVVAGILTYSSYYFFKASDRAMKDYVVRLQYSKDKELLFVTRVSPYGATVNSSSIFLIFRKKKFMNWLIQKYSLLLSNQHCLI